MRIESDDPQAERARFERHGWIITDPSHLREPADHADCIGHSRAEFSVAFSTFDQALAGIEAINADCDGDCRAARALAQRYFASGRLLAQVLRALGD